MAALKSVRKVWKYSHTSGGQHNWAKQVPKVKKKQRNQKGDLCKIMVRIKITILLRNSSIHPQPYPHPREKSKMVCDQVLLQRSLCLFEIGPEQQQLAVALRFSYRIKAKVPALALQSPSGSGVSFSDLNSSQPHSFCSSQELLAAKSSKHTPWSEPLAMVPSSWKALIPDDLHGSLPLLLQGGLCSNTFQNAFSDQSSLNRSHSPWPSCRSGIPSLCHSSHILTYIIFHLL